MNVTNQNPETPKSDSFSVNYDEETGQLELNWDPEDPEWNWLGGLTDKEIEDILTKHAEEFFKEND
jgi:hypothetical protein